MTVLAELPEWLDVAFVQRAALLLAIAAGVVVLLTLYFARSLVVRLVVIVAMGAAVFGLLHYRTELARCDTFGCACSFFGEDLHGGGCVPMN